MGAWGMGILDNDSALDATGTVRAELEKRLAKATRTRGYMRSDASWEALGLVAVLTALAKARIETSEPGFVKEQSAKIRALEEERYGEWTGTRAGRQRKAA